MTANAALTPQQEEFVAFGAAIAVNCTPCMRSHFGKALEAGLTITQLEAAVSVARAVKATPIRHIDEAWRELKGAGTAQPSPAQAGCCG